MSTYKSSIYYEIGRQKKELQVLDEITHESYLL